MASESLSFNLLAHDRASSVFSKVGRAAAETESKFSKANARLAAIGRVAATGALALGGIATAGAAVGLKTAAGMEQARISFTTMLGSARKADVFLKQLAGFAAKTPFEFPELQTAASSLIAAGFQAKKVIPIMTTLGDVTSGMGTGSEGIKRATVALQQMAAAGRITGEDLNQLRDAGIPVFDLLTAATGKSKAAIAAMAQEGKLGRQEMQALFRALESGNGLERFNGLMAQQAQSLNGLWSTFKDTLGMGLARAIQPLIPLLKDGLGGASEFLSTALAKIPPLIEGLIPRLQSLWTWAQTYLVPSLANLASTITAMVLPAGGALLQVIRPLAEAFAGLPTPVQMAALSLATFGRSVAGAVGSMRTRFAEARTEGGLLKTGLLGLSGLVGGPWGLAFAGGVGILAHFASKNSEAKARVDSLAASLDEATGAITRQTRAAVVDQLQKSGAMAAAAQLGLRLADLTDAALGNAEAQERVTSKLRAQDSSMKAAVERLEATTFEYYEWRDASLKVTDAIAGTNRAIDDARTKQSQFRAAMAETGASAEALGRNFTEGLARGIAAGTAAAVAVARGTANKIAAATRAELQMHSPSKVAIDIGKFFSEGLGVGIEEGAKRAIEAVTTLVGKVRDRLRTLRDERRSILDSARTAVLGGLDVAGLGSSATTTAEDGTETTTAQNPADQIKSFAANAKAFSEAIASAVAKGIPPQIVSQIAALGPSQGLTAAQALAALDQASAEQVKADYALAQRYAEAVAQTTLTITDTPEKIAREQARDKSLQDILDDLRNRPRQVVVQVPAILGKQEQVIHWIRDEIRKIDRRRGEG